MSTPKLLAGLAMASIALAACGNGTSGGGSSGKCSGEIKIGVDLPESGNEASNGLPTLNGIKFAVDHQWHNQVEGCTLTIENLDDAVGGVHNPAKGAQNMQQFVADSKVLGVIGPFNSGVAKAEIPISNAAHLVQISPSNTATCITKNPPECAGLAAQLRPGGPNNYFRVAATDDFQGPAMADYAYKTLGITKVAIGSDSETYGKGIADAFQKEFTDKMHGTVVKRQDFDIPSTNDFKPFLTSAQRGGAQGIYFGGTNATKACIVRAQMASIFPASVPELGGDGLQNSDCLKDAGSNVVGIYASVAAADATKIPAAASVIAAYKAAFPNPSDYGAYTMPGYDCANILITGIQKAIDAKGGMPSREDVRAQVAQTSNFPGVLGPTTFDQNGDTSNKIITIYEAKGSPADWINVGQVNYAAS